MNNEVNNDEEKITQYLKLLEEKIQNNQTDLKLENEIIDFLYAKVIKGKIKKTSVLSIYLTMFLLLFVKNYQMVVLARIFINPNPLLVREICSIVNNKTEKKVYDTYYQELKNIKKLDSNYKKNLLYHLLNTFSRFQTTPSIIEEEIPSVLYILNQDIEKICLTQKNKVAQSGIKVYKENVLGAFSKQYYKLTKEEKLFHQKNLHTAIKEEYSNTAFEKELFSMYLKFLKVFANVANIAPEFLNETFRKQMVTYMNEKVECSTENKEQLLMLKKFFETIPTTNLEEAKYIQLLHQTYEAYLIKAMSQKEYFHTQKEIVFDNGVASNIRLLQQNKKEIISQQNENYGIMLDSLQQYVKK